VKKTPWTDDGHKELADAVRWAHASVASITQCLRTAAMTNIRDRLMTALFGIWIDLDGHKHAAYCPDDWNGRKLSSLGISLDSRRPLTLEELKLLGPRIKALGVFLTHLHVAVGRAYPLHSALFARVRRAQRAHSRLRSQLDDLACKTCPGCEALSIFYGADDGPPQGGSRRLGGLRRIAQG
jgi:hypothetical protein